jgi:hypothetical protein
MMNRRFFIRLLGIAPLLGLASKIPAAKLVVPNSGLTLSKLKEAALLLDANEASAEDRWFALNKEQVSRIHSQAFTEQLESEGKLAFTERIDVLPGRAHCVQVHHSRPGTDADKMIDRVTWIDESDYSEAMLEKTRQQTRIAGRRYWAQQARIQRKLALVRTRAIA